LISNSDQKIKEKEFWNNSRSSSRPTTKRLDSGQNIGRRLPLFCPKDHTNPLVEGPFNF
jgi:hypothetical protein